MQPDAVAVQVHSLAMTEGLDRDLQRHLLQHFLKKVRQEDICIVLWRLSEGKARNTAVLFEALFPAADDRTLQGNVSLKGSYLERCLRIAAEKKAGIAILHNHFTPGWQPLSTDDEATESIYPTFNSCKQLYVRDPYMANTMGKNITRLSFACWTNFNIRLCKLRCRNAGNHGPKRY